MEGGDSQFLTASGHVLGGKHGSVGGGFVAIGLYFHAAGDADEGFSAGEIGNVNEGVVKGGEEVGDCEDFLAFDGLGSKFSFTDGLNEKYFVSKGVIT